METSTPVQSRQSHLAENLLRIRWKTADATTVQIFLSNVDGIGSDFLSLVRERIEVRVINLAKSSLQA
jgi:hypothetical protein